MLHIQQIYLMKILKKSAFVSIILLSLAFSNKNERILLFPLLMDNKPAEPYITDRLKKEFNKNGYNNFVTSYRVQKILNEMKIDIENCNDSCLFSIANLVEADNILTGYIISDSNKFSITLSIRSVSTGSLESEISYEGVDFNDLLQFGFYYVSKGITKKRLPNDEQNGKMYTVSLDAFYINDVDFFRLTNGDPYPVFFILNENETPIWKSVFSNLRGYRTIKEKKVLSLVPTNEYKIIIYDAKLRQLDMEYKILSSPNTWPFSIKKHKIGEKSYIILNQTAENDFFYSPNEPIHK